MTEDTYGNQSNITVQVLNLSHRPEEVVFHQEPFVYVEVRDGGADAAKRTPQPALS